MHGPNCEKQGAQAEPYATKATGVGKSGSLAYRSKEMRGSGDRFQREGKEAGQSAAALAPELEKRRVFHGRQGFC